MVIHCIDRSYFDRMGESHYKAILMFHFNWRNKYRSVTVTIEDEDNIINISSFFDYVTTYPESMKRRIDTDEGLIRSIMQLMVASSIDETLIPRLLNEFAKYLSNNDI